MNRKAKNKIKAGALFKKKDMGIIVEVISKGRKGKWTTRRVNKNLGRSAAHQIHEHDLLKHYIRL